jgi:hypothetical protein
MRLRPDLAAERAHVRLKGPAVAHVVRVPYLLHQEGASEHLAGVTNEGGQEPALLGSQPSELAVCEDLLSSEVEDETASGQAVGVSHRSSPAIIIA